MTPLLLFAGFALLAAGTHRQARRLWGRDPGARVRRALLAAGFALLAGSLNLLPAGAVAWVAWFGWLTPAALAPVAVFWALGERPGGGNSGRAGR